MKRFAILLIAAFLSSCASSPKRAENHATDLEVLKMGVSALAEPRRPAGQIQRLEDAQTTGEAYLYAIDLEDALWLSNEDKRRTDEFVRKAVAAIIRARDPVCRWWEFSCKRARYQGSAEDTR